MYPYNHPGSGQPPINPSYPTNIPTQPNIYQNSSPVNSYDLSRSNQHYQNTPQQNTYNSATQQYLYQQPGSQGSYQQSSSQDYPQQFAQGTFPNSVSQGIYPTTDPHSSYPQSTTGYYPEQDSQETYNQPHSGDSHYPAYSTPHGSNLGTHFEIDSSKVKIILSVENIDRNIPSYIQNLSAKIKVDPTSNTFILSDITGICQMEGKETAFRIPTTQGAFETKDRSSLESYNMAEQEFEGPDDSPARPIPDFHHNIPQTSNSYDHPQTTFSATTTPPYQPPSMVDPPYQPPPMDDNPYQHTLGDNSY